MKPRFWVTLLMFISSYAPLVLILAVRDFDYDGYRLNSPDIVWPALAIAAVSCLMLWFVMRQFRGGELAEVLEVENRSVELLNYTIPYLISFLPLEIGQANEMVAFGLFMALMFWLTYKTDNLYINPVLTFFGYGLYRVSVTISGHRYEVNALTRSLPKEGDRFFLERLSPFLYVESGRKQ